MVVAAGVCGEVVQAGFGVAAGGGLSGSVVRVGAAVWVCWWSCWFRVCGGCEEKLKTVSESVVRWSCRSGWSWRLGSVVRSCRRVLG